MLSRLIANSIRQVSFHSLSPLCTPIKRTFFQTSVNQGNNMNRRSTVPQYDFQKVISEAYKASESRQMFQALLKFKKAFKAAQNDEERLETLIQITYHHYSLSRQEEKVGIDTEDTDHYGELAIKLAIKLDDFQSIMNMSLVRAEALFMLNKKAISVQVIENANQLLNLELEQKKGIDLTWFISLARAYIRLNNNKKASELLKSVFKLALNEYDRIKGSWDVQNGIPEFDEDVHSQWAIRQVEALLLKIVQMRFDLYLLVENLEKAAESVGWFLQRIYFRPFFDNLSRMTPKVVKFKNKKVAIRLIRFIEQFEKEAGLQRLKMVQKIQNSKQALQKILQN
ncbi:hypothetical protein M0812_05285 [Anaeramoeba flamelloides]|uniref:Uncharacterized protein n=1 Tax=Anaeramoeba flamelloides TaxID=1746091 RepID=A0AAV8A838_9EUKA|nr:hypothetical protein M0812_05285 [Anaeramoeba flamelloides]